jgi:glycosyltransferase family 2
MDVSIILVNYKTERLLLAAIESVIEKSQGFFYEIIVADNHSGDDSGRIIAQKTWPVQITYIPLDDNLGFGRANNEGIRVATGRYIFLLNTDTLLINNAVQIMVEYMDSHPSVGICGGNLYDQQMRPVHSFARMPSIFDEICELSLGIIPTITEGKNRGFNHTDRPRRVGYITGADMMIRRTALNTAGWFDPDFFMYYEEVELTGRIKKLGYQVVSIPQAKIIHYESLSSGSSENKIRMRMKSRRIYFDKVHGARYRHAADFLFLANLVIRSFLFQILGYSERATNYRTQYRIFKSCNE